MQLYSTLETQDTFPLGEIIFSIGQLIIWSMKFKKILTNANHNSLEAKMTSSNFLHSCKPKDIKFSIIED